MKTMIDKYSNISLLSVFDKYGFVHSGTEFNVLCPFPDHIHVNYSGSFMFRQGTNSFYCWGCSRGGGPIQFVMHFLGISRSAAIEKLSRDFGVKELNQSNSFISKIKKFGKNTNDNVDIKLAKGLNKEFADVVSLVSSYSYDYIGKLNVFLLIDYYSDIADTHFTLFELSKISYSQLDEVLRFSMKQIIKASAKWNERMSVAGVKKNL